MEVMTLTYELTLEESGFSVKCLDWDGVYTQGQTIRECRINAIEATELMLEELLKKSLTPMQHPKIKAHKSSIYTFTLSFDLKNIRYINPNRIKSLKKIKEIHSLEI